MLKRDAEIGMQPEKNEGCGTRRLTRGRKRESKPVPAAWDWFLMMHRPSSCEE